MAFKKGNNLGGRTVGAVSRTNSQLKELIAKIIDNNLETIEADFKELEAKERIRLTIDLMAYVLPKQKAVELTNEGNNFTPIIVNLREELTENEIQNIKKDFEAKY